MYATQQGADSEMGLIILVVLGAVIYLFLEIYSSILDKDISSLSSSKPNSKSLEFDDGISDERYHDSYGVEYSRGLDGQLRDDWGQRADRHDNW